MIQNLDHSLFYLLYNISVDNDFIGRAMVIITNLSSGLFAVIYLASIAYLLFKRDIRIIPFIVGPLLSFITVHTIRFFYLRPRPFYLLEIESLIFHEPTGSLPSMHSTSAFAIAMAIYFIHKKTGTMVLILATITALSRVMVGVHFPLDIVLGAVISVALVSIIFNKGNFSELKRTFTRIIKMKPF